MATIPDRRPGPAAGRSRWLTQWAVTTLAASAVATAFDAVLLQYQRSYFSGGFLATHPGTADRIEAVRKMP